MDWGKQCLKPVVGEFACVVCVVEYVCDDGDYLFWVIPCQINQWFASHPSDFDEIWHTCR